MFMMILMRRRIKTLVSVSLLALFLASASCILPPSKDELSQISSMGEKYLDQQIENAVNGVKEMKTVMEKSSEDHKKFLTALEKTKQQKEEALREAQQMEAKLEQEEEVCNNSMQALWEECKPCLKNSCIKYYSRTCSSGSGLVGRQLEEVLNRTSPFSIWVNGKNVGSLEKEDEIQTQHFHSLEDTYSDMADGVDSIFLDSMKVFDHMRSLQPPFFPSPFQMPSLWGLGFGSTAQERVPRVARSPLQDPDFQGFQSMFNPMMGAARDLFGSMGSSFMDTDTDLEFPTSEDGSINEDVVVTKPFGNSKMTCREIRRNSASCITRLRDECQKCKDIQNIDCSGKKPLEGPLKAGLEAALARTERFTRDYDGLLRRLEEQMLNTSSLLDLFTRQFGWVSALANTTRSTGSLRIHTVISTQSEDVPAVEQENPAETNVSVQVFDSPPMTFSVPGDIPWSDPKFSEVVAQEALDRYKESTVVVK